MRDADGQAALASSGQRVPHFARNCGIARISIANTLDTDLDIDLRIKQLTDKKSTETDLSNKDCLRKVFESNDLKPPISRITPESLESNLNQQITRKNKAKKNYSAYHLSRLLFSLAANRNQQRF